MRWNQTGTGVGILNASDIIYSIPPTKLNGQRLLFAGTCGDQAIHFGQAGPGADFKFQL